MGVLRDGSETGPAISGRYRILRKLGSDSIGTVYVARDARLDRLVALKLIRAEPANRRRDSFACMRPGGRRFVGLSTANRPAGRVRVARFEEDGWAA